MDIAPRPLRLAGVALAIAGLAAVGTVTLAPAASAAPGHGASSATARAEQLMTDAVDARNELLAQLGGDVVTAPSTPAPAETVPGPSKACTMSLPATALENVGCVVDATAPRF